MKNIEEICLLFAKIYYFIGLIVLMVLLPLHLYFGSIIYEVISFLYNLSVASLLASFFILVFCFIVYIIKNRVNL